MKRRYTKTQMRLSSFPAWESPDFPTPSMPVLDMAVADDEAASPLGNLSGTGFRTEVSDVCPRLDASFSSPLDLIKSHLRPLDPWYRKSGPEGWNRFFCSKGFPNPLLAGLRLSYFHKPDDLAERLNSEFSAYELSASGIPAHSLVFSGLSQALAVPVIDQDEIIAIDALKPDGAVLFQTIPMTKRPLMRNLHLVTQSSWGTHILVTNNLFWMLEEIAMARPSIYIESIHEFPRERPHMLEFYPLDLCFTKNEDGYAAMRLWRAKISDWGFHSSILKPDVRENRLISLRLSGEAAAMVSPQQNHPEGLLNRIRDLWERSLHRWKRNH